MEYIVNIINTTLPLLLAPGANNILLMNAGSKHGLMKCLPHVFGSVFGFLMLLMACVFGLSELVIKYPQLLILVKWFGAFWLLKLGWGFITRDNNQTQSPHTEHIQPFKFIKAVTFMLCNPGAFTLALIVFSLSIEGSVYIAYTAACAVGLFATLLWTLNGQLLAPLFCSVSLGTSIRIIFGVLLGFSGIRLILM